MSMASPSYLVILHTCGDWMTDVNEWIGNLALPLPLPL